MDENFASSSALAFTHKRFAVLQELSCLVASGNSFDLIGDPLVELSTRCIGARRGSLMLVSDETDGFLIFISKGFNACGRIEQRISPDHSVAGIVCRNRAPVLVRDITTDERFRTRSAYSYSTNSFISCPVVFRNRTFGLFNMADKADGSSFTPDELEFSKVISNIAAACLENDSLSNRIGVMAHELELIKNRLIESDFVKAGFLSRISHILRTPLNSIKGAIYYLQHSSNLTRRDQFEFFNIISKETGQLVMAIENLLDFLRLQTESLKNEECRINISDLLAEVLNLKMIKTLLSRKHLNPKINIKGVVPLVAGEKIRIIQLFIHLIEALSSGLSNGDTILIDIRDDGAVEISLTVPKKFPGQSVPVLFDPAGLMQPGHADEALKLYLARKIADVHKWSIKTKVSGEYLSMVIHIPKCPSFTGTELSHAGRGGDSPETE